jgi:hypothetical protein
MGSRIEDSGENGLAQIWLEIRAWISWCDCSAHAQPLQQANVPERSFPQFLEEVAEAKVPLSQIRRADIEKWVAGTRDWERPLDEFKPKLPNSLP